MDDSATARINVYLPLSERLKSLPASCVGILVGFYDEDLAHAVGFVINKVGDEEVEAVSGSLTALPGGLQAIGLFASSQLVDDEAQLTSVKKSLPVNELDLYVFLAYDDGRGFLWESDGLAEASVAMFDKAELDRLMVTAHITGALRLTAPLDVKEINSAIERMHVVVSSEAAAYRVTDTDVILLADETSSETAEEETVEGILTKERRQGVVKLKYLTKATGSCSSRLSETAPVIHYERKDQRVVRTLLQLDCVALLPRSADLCSAASICSSAVCNQLEDFRSYLVSACEGAQSLGPLETLHFLPPVCGHSVSLVCSRTDTDADLKNVRENLHKAFHLPLDRPMFRRANRWLPGAAESYLTNVHVGVTPPKDGGATVAVVDGVYSYHHYMQDRMDDDGWGCAYRSLQTLVSWFRKQGYTERPIPTHREVQQCLVDLGDKPESFVGSRQWIGSSEVAFCLDSLLGVTSRILHVSSGGDINTKGRELLTHFLTQGTPVMIGGGVLAHTILGVSFNESTGETHTLVLDPHYTGAEDLRVIQARGWCGWKDCTFWDPKAYYNLCLPQRPVCF